MTEVVLALAIMALFTVVAAMALAGTAWRRISLRNEVSPALRIRPPVQILFRQPNEDVELGGVAIPAGSIVALGYASANHDEAVFPSPDEFDLDRGEALKKHLGFGWGIHLCVGAPLARMELQCALAAVLDRIPALSLAPDFTYDRVRFFMMRGPKHMRVVF